MDCLSIYNSSPFCRQTAFAHESHMFFDECLPKQSYDHSSISFCLIKSNVIKYARIEKSTNCLTKPSVVFSPEEMADKRCEEINFSVYFSRVFPRFN